MSYIDNETTQKVINLTSKQPNKKLHDLLQSLSTFNQRFSSSSSQPTASDMQLKRQKELDISDDEIKQNAQSELFDYKQKTKQNIETQTKEKEKQLLQNKEDVQANYSQAKQQTQDYYQAVKEDASNDALKRGLARSSIVINTLDAFNKDELNTFNALNKDFTDSLNEIDFQLNSLDSKQQQALADFDIEYAAKLNKKISDLKKEYTNIQNEIIKYNNQITEAENNFNLKYAQLEKSLQDADWKKELDLIELSGKFGANVIERYKQNQILSIINNQLNSSSKQEQAEILNSQEIANMLSEDALNQLRTQYGV